jgi:hypothetical protein
MGFIHLKNQFLLRSTDTLYWWDEMDKNNIIVFFLGKLNNQCASTSAATPAAASKKQKKSADTVSNKKQNVTNDHQKEMVEHVAGLRKSIASVAASGIQGQINNYRKDIFNLQEKKFMTNGITQEYINLIDNRINEIKKSIQTLEENLESLEETQPKTLTY